MFVICVSGGGHFHNEIVKFLNTMYNGMITSRYFSWLPCGNLGFEIRVVYITGYLPLSFLFAGFVGDEQ